MTSRRALRALLAFNSSAIVQRPLLNARLSTQGRWQLRQTPPSTTSIASTRPFTLSHRLRQNEQQQDGLRNNRDQSTASSSPNVSPLSNLSTADADLLSKLPAAPHSRAEVPSYAIVFTCKKCDERSAHKISKQGYHHGTVMVQCPSCKSRHLISDHLKIFSDNRITLEDILREKGSALNKLAINEDGDLEFWNEEGEHDQSKPHASP